MLDLQTMINFGLGAILAALGWFARQVWDAVKLLQRDVHALEVDLPKTYTSKADFHDSMKHIETLFQRIYDKLDAKADKE